MHSQLGSPQEQILSFLDGYFNLEKTEERKS